MNENKKALNLFFILTAALALLLSGIRIAMTLLYLEPSYGVYSTDTLLPTLSHILIFVAMLGMAIFGLTISKKYPCPTAPEIGSATTFFSCLNAFLIAAISLISIYNIVVRHAGAEKFSVIRIIASIPTVIFFLVLIKPDKKNSSALAFMSFFPIAWFADNLLESYFDTTLLITSPAKTIRELALLAAMLYLLCESRFLIERSNGRLFFIMSGIAPIIMITSSLPALILPDLLLVGSSDSFLCYAVELAFALFILARGFAFAKAPGTLPKPEKPPKDKKKEK